MQIKSILETMLELADARIIINKTKCKNCEKYMDKLDMVESCKDSNVIIYVNLV